MFNFKELFNKSKEYIKDRIPTVVKNEWSVCPKCGHRNRSDFENCVICNEPLKKNTASEEKEEKEEREEQTGQIEQTKVLE